MRKSVFLFGLLCLLVGSNAGYANLIVNGGFEDIGSASAVDGYGSASTWQIYTEIPGWDADRNLEIWNDGFIVDPYEGSRILELNAHPANSSVPFKVFQEVETIAGAQYTLSFYARNRRGDDERFNVSVDGIVNDLSWNISDHVQGSWTQFSRTFTASGDISQLSFMSLDGLRDTTGNLIDSVSLVAVPEPGSLALLTIGLLGLGVTRRLQR